MSKNHFTYKFVTDPLDVARYLEALKQGFENGELRLSEQNNQITLKPAEILELTVDLGRRKGRINLSVAMSWAETPGHKQLSLSFDNLNEAENPDDVSGDDPDRTEDRGQTGESEAPET
ncbi:MAG: amphi-Trp domain-containing protein [Deltaproteobacteria bacterium]|jgi:amphi-Trp domain-containing protein|nr:amphi-Trp domain-containing protein [Deltaproteobacteria bacterium]